MAKFLKFNFQEGLKSLLILTAVCLGSAAAAKILGFSNTSAIIFIRSIFSILSVVAGAGMIVYSFIYSWMNFYNSEYSDKAYLIRTLPIKRTSIFDAVFITSVFYITVSVCIFLLAVYLCMPEDLRNILSDMLNSLGENKYMLLMIAAGALMQMIFGLQCGFTGMLFGMKRKNSRIGWSILFGILIYYICELIMVGSIFAVFLTTGNNFFESEVITIQQGKQLLSSLVIVYIIINVLFFFYNRSQIAKGVDVDL